LLDKQIAKVNCMPLDQITAPFYADWKFWSFVASTVAIALSQLPPLHILIRSARLSIEAYSQMFITHKYGNPNSHLHLIVSNPGGRKVRVTGINLTMKSKTGQPFTMPAGSYRQNQTDKETVLFTPFSLLPGEEWAHIVYFYPTITRQDDKHIRASRAALRTNIEQKRALREDPGDKSAVRADEAVVAPFIQIFERQFKWLPDEYEMTLSVTTNPPYAIEEARFRFVVYESDTAQMRTVVADYVFGAGVYFDGQNEEGINVPLEKKQGE
jgi:hypothetical protein